MQKYGLKVSSPYKLGEKIYQSVSGDIVLTNPGNYHFFCEEDTKISHNLVNDLFHITCETKKDNLNIKILASGTVNLNEICDVKHVVIANHQNLSIEIKAKGVANQNGKMIYRSELIANEFSSGFANQKGDFILLSDEAEVDAEPGLDILNFNFLTKHAISVSGVDIDKIWYMTLHGLDSRQAENDYINSFLIL